MQRGTSSSSGHLLLLLGGGCWEQDSAGCRHRGSLGRSQQRDIVDPGGFTQCSPQHPVTVRHDSPQSARGWQGRRIPRHWHHEPSALYLTLTCFSKKEKEKKNKTEKSGKKEKIVSVTFRGFSFVDMQNFYEYSFL